MRDEYGVYNRASKPSRIFSAGSQRTHADSWSGGRTNNQYFQATTQIQEQTLAFVPKIVAVLLALLLFGPWIVTKLIDFTSQILGNLYMYIG